MRSPCSRLEYDNEDYENRRKWSQANRTTKVTLIHRIGSSAQFRSYRVVWVVEFEEASNKDISRPTNQFVNTRMHQPYDPTGLFAQSIGCITSFVRWIEDYPLPDGLKILPHVGSYDGKGTPDNYLHLFEGVIRMQKWAMPIVCHMFTYTLKIIQEYGGMGKKQVA
ncbi:hypothetical protein Tco_0673803 [Tanacetum coccineum]